MHQSYKILAHLTDDGTPTDPDDGVKSAEKGAPGGVATLGPDGKIPASQLSLDAGSGLGFGGLDGGTPSGSHVGFVDGGSPSSTHAGVVDGGTP